MTWTTEQLDRNVHEIRFDGISEGWEQRVLLRSDAHHDNLKNDWKLEKSHLEKALQYNAPIIDNGDAFCAMQGKYDPRKDLNQLKPEHKRKDYLDALVETAAADYEPYADLFAVMGMGNHEDSILDKLGTNLTGNLVHRLNTVKDRQRLTQLGGYSGWVFFRFRAHKTKRSTLKLHYFHGAGGGGPVTRGVIQTNRQAVFLPDADIVISGHTHDSWVVPIPRVRISQMGKIYHDNQWHVRTGTYKNDYGDGHEGWHVTTGKPPKAMGAVWMVFRFNSSTDRIETYFEIDLK